MGRGNDLNMEQARQQMIYDMSPWDKLVYYLDGMPPKCL